MINTFYLDEESAEAYGLIMLAPPDHVVAERDIERKEVPGRSGDVIIDNGRYKNVTVKYSCAILPEDGVPYRTTVARAVQFFEIRPRVQTASQHLRPRPLPRSTGAGQLFGGKHCRTGRKTGNCI